MKLSYITHYCHSAPLPYKFQMFCRDKFYDAKYAIQRVKRGYDNVILYDFCSSAPILLSDILTDYKDKKHCVFNERDENGKRTGISLSKSETNAILDNIINHLTLIDEEKCAKDVFGKETVDLSVAEYAELYNYIDEHKNTAFDLLKKWWFEVWD